MDGLAGGYKGPVRPSRVHCAVDYHTAAARSRLPRAYRTVYPSAVTHPGFTWVASNEDAEIGKLAWAPKADERDRIDFIFYKGTGVRSVKAAVLGPKASVIRGKRADETSQDPIIEPQGTWPSDHKGVLVTLEWQ